MEKLNILQVASNYYPEKNGVAYVIKNISERLVQRGHSVTVATKNIVNRNVQSHNGVEIIEFNLEGDFINGLKGDIAPFQNYLINSNYDIHHHHTTLNWSFDSIIDIIDDLTVPIVLTPHGLQSNPNTNKNYLNILIKVFQKLDLITCLSESFDEYPFCNQHNIKHSTVINNGVDLNEIPQCNDTRKVDIDVVNVSNHNGFKGHDRYFELVKLLPDNKFIQIGNSHPAGKYNLGKLGIKGGCYYKCCFKKMLFNNFNGYYNIPRNEVISLLRRSRIFALTSNWEASPLVILEAMAMGKPWVSFDVGNVKDHSGGYVVDSLDEMSKRILQLLSDNDLYEQKSKEGISRVKAKHDWDKITLDYELEYYKVIEAKM